VRLAAVADWPARGDLDAAEAHASGRAGSEPAEMFALPTPCRPTTPQTIPHLRMVASRAA
jgi:hypothetical protein